MFQFLHLGDSYTCGEGLPAPSSWPYLLKLAFELRHVPLAEPTVLAQTGWTSDELSLALDAAEQRGEIQAPYDIVTLAVGVNNQYRGLSLETYRESFQTLLKRAVALAQDRPRRVFVLSIPDWSVTPFVAQDAQARTAAEIASQIQAFNQVNASLTYAAGAQYINVTELSRKARWSLDLLVDDHLHYSEKMYRDWALELYPKIWRELLPDKNLHVPLLYQRTDLKKS